MMEAVKKFTFVFGDGTSFRVKVFVGQLANHNFTSVLAREPHFVRKGCDGNPEIAILHHFLPIEPHFVRKGSPETRNRNFTSVFGVSCERVAPGSKKWQFYLSFWRERVAFRAVSLALPRAFKREIEKK